MINEIEIILRETQPADLDKFFVFQLDEEACYLAAFMSVDHADQSAYISKYSKFLSDPTINMQTIIVDDTIVGSIAKFEIKGEAEITYWIDKKYWGMGIATDALSQLLILEKMRPVTGRTAFDNIASQKVLESCGFVKTGTDKGFANARKVEIEEFIYKVF